MNKYELVFNYISKSDGPLISLYINGYHICTLHNLDIVFIHLYENFYRFNEKPYSRINEFCKRSGVNIVI